MPEPRRHHYIPIFYLKRWTGPDGRLCEFSRPFKQLKPMRKHPAATAYVVELYTVHGLAEEHAQIMEKVFMSTVDNTAAAALAHMLSLRNIGPIPGLHKAVWARFLYSLNLRTPEHLAWARTRLTEMLPDIVEAERHQYLAKRTEADPATFEEFRESFINDSRHTDPNRQLHRFISNGVAASHILKMRWSMRTLLDTKFSLLTSDRPLVMTNGLAGATGHLVLPVSPTQIFVAANSEETERRIQSIEPEEIVRTLNTRVVEQARKYVYGQDDRQLRFVSNRFGKMVPATPLG